MKKIFYIILLYVLSFQTLFASVRETKDSTIKDKLLGGGREEDVISNTTLSGEDNLLLFVIQYLKDSLFGILALVAVGVFLFIGIKLASARGNPEELKKAFTSLIYAVVGLFFVSAAWAIVKLVTGLNITT